MASRKYSKNSPGQSTQIISPPLRQNFLALDDRIMGANAAAQVTPDMTVVVTGFDYLGADGTTWRTYAGGNSPAFAAPTVNPKIGALTVNDVGSLAWTYGAEAAVPLKPSIPAGTLPICFVHGRVGMTTITDDDVGPNGFILAQASALRATAGTGTPVVSPKGQCRLVWSSATALRLDPYNGNVLTINSVDTVIPDAGVTLGTGGLSANTVYYIYAYLVGAVMTLEAVTTAPVTQAGTGLKIKGGPVATRTLVGMANTNPSTQFTDTLSYRGVASYWNRPARPLYVVTSANRTTSATTDTALHGELFCYVVGWADEGVQLAVFDQVAVDDIGGYVSTGMAMDGGTVVATSVFQGYAVNTLGATAASAVFALTEGTLHNVSFMARVNAGTTVATFYAGVCGLAGTIG